MRSTLAIAAVLLGALGCAQEPDFVASATPLNESGAGGTGGEGGTGGSAGGQASTCDLDAANAAFLFNHIVGNCTYRFGDTQLRTLLEQIIYSMPMNDLTLEQAEATRRDPYCAATEEAFPQLRPLRWRFAVENPELTALDMQMVVICPLYCDALRAWTAMQLDLVAQCLPDAGT